MAALLFLVFTALGMGAAVLTYLAASSAHVLVMLMCAAITLLGVLSITTDSDGP